MYQYKHVTLPCEVTFKSKKGDSFEKCFSVINEEAKNGWRLVQIFTPMNEKSALLPYGYEIIFEKEVNENVSI